MVRLGGAIDIRSEDNHLYLPPEVYRGTRSSAESCVFNLGCLWDEMLHGSLYFHNIDELENNSRKCVRILREISGERSLTR